MTVDTSHRTRTNRPWEGPHVENDQLLNSVKDVARRLRESEGTVYRLIRSGELPAVRRTEGGLLKIHEADLLNFIKDSYREA